MIRILFFTFITWLLFIQTATARDFTKPTSMALRTEISFVNVATLVEKKYTDTNTWQLKFKPIEDIHNSSPNEVTTVVSADLAHSLATNVNYIMAYHTHQKTKVNGLVEYQPLANGATLMQVEGGNPAIYRYDERLKNQFLIDPKIAQTDPLELINTIMTGMKAKDPKVQEFFVRELINWVGLPDHLTHAHHQQLLTLFTSNEASVATLTALLENRTAFHQAMGIEKMAVRVTNLLEALPIHMEPNSELPAMVLQALSFSNNHAMDNWNLYSRWTRSNIPSITEKALLSLHDLNAKKTHQLAKERINETHISDTSRRVLIRYLKNQNKKIRTENL